MKQNKIRVPCKYNGAYKKKITKTFTEKNSQSIIYKEKSFIQNKNSDPIEAVCTKIVA